MICVDYDCNRCAHLHKELLDGWKPTCKAFPEGIPGERMRLKDDGTECANGLKYEENPDDE